MAGADWPPTSSVSPEEAGPVDTFTAALRKTVQHPAMDALSMELWKDPWHYDFFMAVRRLECVRTDLPRVGMTQRPSDDAVRFCQEASLSFAPSTVSRFDPATPEKPARMYVNFLGLLGPNGPLPLHVTEYVRDRVINGKDQTLTRFMDFLIHRHISLFYRSWAINQQTVSYDREEEDRFSTYIGSLFGLGMESYRNRDAVRDAAKLHYSGRLVNTTRHAEGLRAIVEDYFGIKTEIRQFVGQWIDLPEDSRCKLGQSRMTGLLGSTAIVGSRIWQCQYKFRIRLGAMDFKAYTRMLPGGDSLVRLIAWVKNYIGDELAWDVQLVLKGSEVPPTALGKGGRLGWSTWLKSRPIEHDVADLILTPPGAA